MRFLCLHGSGTTGTILNIQLSSVIQKAQPQGHTFDFWDGPFPSKAGPGVGPFFDPPFYVWYQDNASPEIIRSAAQNLLVKMRQQKQPYDAVIGFSQGTALLTSLLLMCKNEWPDEPLPFKGAIFFCGGVPFQVLENYMEVPQKAKDLAFQTRKDLDAASVANAKKIEEMMETGARVDMWDFPNPMWDGKEKITRDPWKLPELDKTDVFGMDVSNLPDKATLDIPAVVVYGHKDPMAAFHVQLAMLCKAANRITYDHRGGHEIPRSANVTNDLVKAVEWLDEKIKATG